jgi:hypothetical protein
MRIDLTALTLSAAILAALPIGSVDVCRAQSQSEPNTESVSLVEVSSLPTKGNFWSMQFTNWPPLPFSPSPNFQLFTDGTPGNYYYNDIGFDWAQVSAAANTSASGASATDDVLLPPSGGGTNGYPAADPARKAAPLPCPAAMFLAKLGPISGFKYRPLPVSST